MIESSARFLIVGLGLIGGSYARGLSAKGYHVDAIDHNQASLEFALSQGFIQQGAIESDSLIAAADVILLALYPSDIVNWIKEHQGVMKSSALLSDVGGVKHGLVEEIQGLLRTDLEFIGAHPMAGKEVSGVVFSDEKIFFPANFIITPTERNTKRGIAMAESLGQILGFARISILSPQKHDEMIGFLSQLTHVIAVCLMNTHESEHLVAYTGDSFRDLTRIAKINETLWSELFLLNKEILQKEIAGFVSQMEVFASTLETGDRSEMERLMVLATERRKAFDR